VQKQVVLPWGQSIRICAASVRARMGRSVLTLLGVVLAVAFMASVLTTADMTDRLIAGGDANTLFRLAQATGIDVNDAAARRLQRQRDHWLIGLSVLVATVGIVNSVLMSVTERVREIGTMKCLGALDAFIVRLFFLESMFAGVIGAAIGAPIGIGLAGVRMGWAVGFRGIDWPAALAGGLINGLIALATGTGITVLAAVYPAYVAARMQPAEAMRAEE
jgi:ABC-type antimicrobial peptide transport system permease subunit